jgi:alpha-glucosidase
MLVGEVYLFDVGRLAAYVEPDQLHMAHNFIFAQLPWDAAAFRAAIATAPGAWPAWFVGNHDMPRPATRLGPRQARAALLLLYALRGTPFIYQGEELGLPDAAIPPERIVDVDGRDPARAPIPWRPGRGHGFTTGEPWLPFAKHPDALTQAHDPGSALTLARALARLRREMPDLQEGAQRLLDAPPGVLAFARGDSIAAVVNFRGEPAPMPVAGERLLSTAPHAGRQLSPFEAVLLRRG